MKKEKAFSIRMKPALAKAITMLAEKDMRSVNAEVNVLLHEAVMALCEEIIEKRDTGQFISTNDVLLCDHWFDGDNARLPKEKSVAERVIESQKTQK